MAFHVKTTVFQGPLDLLLQLITKHEVEIAAVGLTEVVGEYLSFLDEMREMDSDVTSEFLLRLLSLLLVCVTFKDVAAVLRRRLQDGNRYVPRVSGLDQDVRAPLSEVTMPIDAEGLAVLAAKVFIRPSQELDLDHLDLDLPNIESAIEDLRLRIEAATTASFEDLIEHCDRPVEVAAYFLALLEMARWGLIEVAQDDWLSSIEVRHRDDGIVNLTSEWAL